MRLERNEGRFGSLLRSSEVLLLSRFPRKGQSISMGPGQDMHVIFQLFSVIGLIVATRLIPPGKYQSLRHCDSSNVRLKLGGLISSPE